MKTSSSLSAILAAVMVLGTGSVVQAGHDRHERHDDRHDRRYDCWDHRRDHRSGGVSLSFGFYNPPPVYYSRPVVVQQPVVYVNRETVTEVQIALNRRGFYYGIIDGLCGPQTRSAIASYQSSRSLHPTGQIDYALLRTLGLS
jgi:hypothetical protein